MPLNPPQYHASVHGPGEKTMRARPRDVEAVTKPRTEPVSLCSLAIAVVKAWQTGRCSDVEINGAIQALANHLGPLAK